MTKPLEKAAGYIRMSSDQQEASPERQKAELRKLCAAHGCTIPDNAWYEDLGKTGTESKKRGGFQKLLVDCEKRKWRTVFYYEPSRLSREHPLDSLAHLNVFRKAGVRLISTVRGVVDCNDIGGLIMSVVDAHGAHDESIKIATRAVSGYRAKYARGERVCGKSVFGFDRELIDETGEVAKRVHFRERFTKPRGWQQRLVVSADVEAVAAVREAFRRFLDGDYFSDLVDEFNTRGLTTSLGKPFGETSIINMLKNPVYCGTLVGGVRSTGKFRRVDEDGLVWIENAHEAIVSKRLFDAVQAEMRRRHKTRRRSDPGKHLLGTLVCCDHCGAVLYGTSHPTLRMYAGHTKHHSADCPRPAVNAERLEAVVLTIVRELALNPANVRRVARECADVSGIGQNEPDPAEGQLRELRRKIETAQANLALAESPEDFRSISTMLGKWREQAETLSARLKHDVDYESDRSEVAGALGELSQYAAHLHLADRYMLAGLIQAIVQRVVVGQRWVGSGRGRYRQWHGYVEFDKDAWDGPPVEICDMDLAPLCDRRFLELGQFVRQHKEPITTDAVASHYGLSRVAARNHLRKAETAGIVEFAGRYEGWRRSSAGNL